jgi:hypothetical protein
MWAYSMPRVCRGDAAGLAEIGWWGFIVFNLISIALAWLAANIAKLPGLLKRSPQSGQQSERGPAITACQ